MLLEKTAALFIDVGLSHKSSFSLKMFLFKRAKSVIDIITNININIGIKINNNNIFTINIISLTLDNN